MKTRDELIQDLQDAADKTGEMVGWLHLLVGKQVVDLKEYRRVRTLVQNARILLDQARWELTGGTE